MLDEKTLALLGDHDAAQRMTERGELLPCPFCKCNPALEEGFGSFDYRCNTDGCRGSSYSSYGDDGGDLTYSSEYEARKAWNTRAPLLTPVQLALLGIAREPRKFEEGSK